MIGSELYQIAKKYLGKGGATFRKFCGLASNAPYCCAYVCYIFFTNGLNKLFYGGKKVVYCPNAIKWCQANLAQLPLYMAMPMDIAFFDWNKNGVPDHIGFIKAKISATVIRTHEGNTSGGIVAEKNRTVGYMMGGVFRPLYAPKGLQKEVLVVDGDFGYKSIYMLQTMLGVKADGIFGKETLKAFQRLIGVAPDASWGKRTTLAAQKFVGVKADGEWGPLSTLALQTTINKKCFPNGTKVTQPVVQESKGYTGAFPDLIVHSGQIIAWTAIKLAWAKGTKKEVYKYPKGSATKAFKTAINKVFPKRSSWSKQCQAGASCDVGAATVIRYSGYDTSVPRGLQEQLTHFRESSLWTKTGQKKCTKVGDVAMHPSPSAHIWIRVRDGIIAEANHTWKYFLHLVTDNRKINNKDKAGVYRACKPSLIKKGDGGTEVVKLQSFLNWFGNYILACDGDFGSKTESALKDFQKKKSLEQDAVCGSKTLEAMKATRK